MSPNNFIYRDKKKHFASAEEKIDIILFFILYVTISLAKGRISQGTKWYKYHSGNQPAFGFAPGQSDLTLSCIDYGTTDNEKRLSWWWDVPNFGGYRCGSEQHLHGSSGWELIFFSSN